MTRRVREHDLVSSFKSRARRERPSLRPLAEALEGRSLLSTAGSPDSTFGTPTPIGSSGVILPGLAQVQFQPADADHSNSVDNDVIQSDGKVVVVGYTYTLNTAIPETASDAIAVGRLNTNGSLDTTFGTNGVVILPATSGFNTGQAVAIQSNGDIVVAADVSPGTTEATQSIAVYRLTPTGTLDTTFGTGGSTTFAFMQGTTPLFSTANVLAIDPGGNIVVGGSGSTSTSGTTRANYLPALARLTPGGVLDASFGNSGQVLPSFANTTGLSSFNYVGTNGVAGLVVQSDGSILFDASVVPTSGSGATAGSIAVGKLTPTGAFDTTFGTGGQVLLGTNDGAGALAVQSDGKLIVAGASDIPGTGTTTYHFDVYRLNTNGTLDTTFGTAGEATPDSYTIATTITTLWFDRANSVLIQPNGTILVGGYAITGITPNVLTGSGYTTNSSVVALNSNGSTDLEYGSGGMEILPTAYDEEILGDNLIVQPNGQILDQLGAGVVRLLSSGSVDDFNEDGTSDPAVLLPNATPYPVFAYRPSGGGADVLNYFGTPGAGNTLPAPGAYDGAGIDEEAVYLPTNGVFGIRPYGTTGSRDKVIPIGLPNSIPAQADYTGSGFTQVGVFEPATATFVYSTNNSTESSSIVSIPFGTPGAGNSIPVPADYDGSGRDDIAVYLPAIGAYAYRPAGTIGQDDTFVFFGTPGAGNSIPVPADYDGSGHTEIAVYLSQIGAFAYRPYGTTGQDDQIIPFGIAGAGQSIPMPGDYDGSGHTELAVYMPSLDAIAYRPYGTTGQDDKVIYFGQPGVGNTVPFNAEGAAYIESEGNGSGGGGGGGFEIRPNVAGWVDFVPTPAGQAKKGSSDATASTAGSGGQS